MSSVSELLTATVASTAAAVSSSASGNRAAPQGGILDDPPMNPTVWNKSNPIILFIIQAGIIIIFCRILHYPLSRLRQPRVIAEVIGGILLGPSVMMRIPGFEETIFPTASMPVLNMAANLGLILFLFLVGLEVNMKMFSANWRVALSVGFAGMIIPFGLGCAIAWGLFNQFHDDPGTVPIAFPVYMLFIGTALSITAFPVLCRILTELKLLNTAVGVTTLAAGVGNDVTGWILLALCVALVNNGSGITALYVLLTCVAWILFLCYAVRPCFMILLRRTGSLQNGPTQMAMAVTVLLILTSAWFTGIIGVHPIFGAFLIGLICPHEGGFAIKVTERMEDLVSVLFLPLYFAFSGLSTNLGLLNDGVTWAYVIGVIAVAFAGKIIGGTIAARACKLLWRESFTIGVLMSCKGLVELIVLNIGLSAKILSQRTFTIFVVMALVTTVTTTPLTLALYPPWYQKKVDLWKRGKIDWEGNPLHLNEDNAGENSTEKLRSTHVRRLLVYLRLDSLPGLFTFITLLGGENSAPLSSHLHRSKQALETVREVESSDDAAVTQQSPLEVHGVRLLELTERTSSVMQSSEMRDYTLRDPVVNAFRTFAQLNNVAVSGEVTVVPEASYAEALNSQAQDHFSDLVLIPWSESGNMSEDSLWPSSSIASGNQDSFIQEALDTATCNIAVFINRGFGIPLPSPPLSRQRSNSIRPNSAPRSETLLPVADRSHHIFFPFFGGFDDRAGLRFVLQLARNRNVTATVIHFITSVTIASLKAPASSNGSRLLPQLSGSVLQVTQPEATATELAASATLDTNFLQMLRDTLSEDLQNRVVFTEITTSAPLADCLHHASAEMGNSPKNAGDLIVVGRGKGSRLGIGESERDTLSGEGREMKKTIGVVGDMIVSAGVRGSVLVIQAGKQ